MTTRTPDQDGEVGRDGVGDGQVEGPDLVVVLLQPLLERGVTLGVGAVGSPLAVAVEEVYLLLRVAGDFQDGAREILLRGGDHVLALAARREDQDPVTADAGLARGDGRQT